MLLTLGDEGAIEKDFNALERLGKDVSADITTRLRYMIISVDGNSEISHINKYINGMLARDSKALRNYVKSISPDMDMTTTHTYDDGETEALSVTLGVNFFWPAD